MKALHFHVPLFLGLVVSVAASSLTIAPDKEEYSKSVKDNATLQWNILGSGYDTIKWSTYLNSTLEVIWGTDKDGKKDVNVPEQDAYKGRLSATKVKDSVYLFIRQLTRQDNNTYYCTLKGFGKFATSSGIALIVKESPTSSPSRQPTPPTEKSNLAAILGGVIGGVAVVVLVIVGFVVYKKKCLAAQEGSCFK